MTRRARKPVNITPCGTCGEIGEPMLCNRVGCPYQGPHLGDPRLSEMRQVVLHYVDRVPSVYLIHQSEVDRFVRASVRLHFTHGNPHRPAKPVKSGPAKIWKITVSSLQPTGPFWWTTPDLRDNHDPNGARVFNGDYGPHDIAFLDEVSVKRWQAEEERAEYEDR